MTTTKAVTITLTGGKYVYSGDCDADGNVPVGGNTTVDITWTPVGFQFGSFTFPTGTPFSNASWSATSASITDANNGSKATDYSYSWTASSTSNPRPVDPKIKNEATPTPLGQKVVKPQERAADGSQPARGTTQRT